MYQLMTYQACSGGCASRNERRLASTKCEISCGGAGIGSQKLKALINVKWPMSINMANGSIIIGIS